MSDVESWSTVDATNSVAPPDGFPEGMNRSDFNNSARAVMGAMRRYFNASEFVNLYAEPLHVVNKVTDTQFRVVGVDVTADFPVDRRVQITDGITTVSGFVTNAGFAVDTTVTVVLDSGVIPPGTDTVLVHSGKTLKKLAFRNTLPMDSVVDVKEDFGATGDGSTPDHVAIQNAIDAVEAAGGGTVYFPPGLYLCNVALTVESSGITLLGANRRASVLVNGSATNYLLTIGIAGTDTNGIRVNNLGFTTNAGVVASAGGCILLRRCSRGIVLSSLSMGGTNFVAGMNSPYRGIESDGVIGRNFGILIDDIHCVDTIAGGIYCNNGADFNVRNCAVSGAGADGGIILDTVIFTFVSNCDLLLNSPCGLRVRQTFAPVAPSNGVHDVFFNSIESESNFGPNYWITRGNILEFSNCVSLSISGAVPTNDAWLFDGSGVPLSDITNIALANCLGQAGERHGFNFMRVQRLAITGCRAQQNSQLAPDGAGIMLDGCEDCSVVGNNVVEPAAGSIQKYGVRVANASARNLIASNLALNNVTKDFEDTASGANLWSNNRSDDALPTTASATATLPIPNLTDQVVTMTSVVQTDFFSGHTHIGKPFTIITQGAVTFRHAGGGGNLRLASAPANLTATAGSRITWVYDGTNYLEIGRSLA